ncbi:hypothetical protein LX36DRAFT_656025 [Colletotrichum falcatum]|nr:hypothetical protein LX36DRAFT_656025 [Colletotrichum falcatum]
MSKDYLCSCACVRLLLGIPRAAAAMDGSWVIITLRFFSKHLNPTNPTRPRQQTRPQNIIIIITMDAAPLD